MDLPKQKFYKFYEQLVYTPRIKYTVVMWQLGVTAWEGVRVLTFQK